MASTDTGLDIVAGILYLVPSEVRSARALRTRSLDRSLFLLPTWLPSLIPARAAHDPMRLLRSDTLVCRRLSLPPLLRTPYVCAAQRAACGAAAAGQQQQRRSRRRHIT